MRTFEIRARFLLAGEPFRFPSASFHSFPLTPEDCPPSLSTLNPMAFNPFETSVP